MRQSTPDVTLDPTRGGGTSRLNLFNSNEFGKQNETAFNNTKESHQNYFDSNERLNLDSHNFNTTNEIIASHRYIHSSDISTSKQRGLNRKEMQQSMSSNSSSSPNRIHAKRLNDNTFSNKSDRPKSKGDNTSYMEESRRYIDKMFTEGNDILVPVANRKDFKIVYSDRFGREFHSDLMNSDLVFFNEFHERLKAMEYSQYKRD